MILFQFAYSVLGALCLMGGAAFNQPVNGQCYLALFTGNALAAARSLPALASVADLRRIANSHGNPYAVGTFGLQAEEVNSQAVWHVVEGPWSAATCVSMMDKGALVGAVGEDAATARDVSRQVHEVAERAQQTALDLKTTGPVFRKRFHFSFTLGGTTNAATTFNMYPYAISRVVSVSKLFESVRLEAMSAEIVVDASANSRVGIGINTQNVHARDLGHIRKMAHNAMAYGHSDGPKITVWDLPVRMNFSREYKMANVGNGPGYVCFHLAGGHTNVAEVNGFMEIAFTGEGISLPIRLLAEDQKTGVNGVVRDDDDSESEDDE